MRIENCVSPERPRKWSKGDERKLVITSKRNPFLTAKEIAEYMQNAENCCKWRLLGYGAIKYDGTKILCRCSSILNSYIC